MREDSQGTGSLAGKRHPRSAGGPGQESADGATHRVLRSCPGWGNPSAPLGASASGCWIPKLDPAVGAGLPSRVSCLYVIPLLLMPTWFTVCFGARMWGVDVAVLSFFLLIFYLF